MAILNKLHILSALLVAACSLGMTACSSNDLSTFTKQVSQLSSTLFPSAPQVNADKSRELGEATKTLTAHADVDTAAARLKHYYHFTSSDEIAAAGNTGKGNSGWVASAMAEGTDWSAQPGSYYRMNRIWGKTDHLTLEVNREGNNSKIIATYRSEDPTHLNEAWTQKLWVQIGSVAEGKIH